MVMVNARLPKGYLGNNHETIGSDIRAVLLCVQQPQLVFDPATYERLSQVRDDAWYPIGWLLELMEMLEAKIGRYGMLKMGRTLFQLSHAKKAKELCKSARDLIYALDDMYHNANRGRFIGGWRVVKFEPGLAELEKTTPHNCMMEEGMLAEALRTIEVPTLVEQQDCFRKGASCCRYLLTSAITDGRWTG